MHFEVFTEFASDKIIYYFLVLAALIYKTKINWMNNVEQTDANY